MDFLERLSCLLGKQYLFKQDNGIYFNRYISKNQTKTIAEDWIIKMLWEYLGER